MVPILTVMNAEHHHHGLFGSIKDHLAHSAEKKALKKR
jgi:hypothetical protein